MKASTISRLLARGIPPTHPGFRREAARLESTDLSDRQRRHKEAFTAGMTRILHLEDPGAIQRWLAGDGRAIRVGRVEAIEIWKRGEEQFLAAKGQTWEVFRLRGEAPPFVIVSRVV